MGGAVNYALWGRMNKLCSNLYTTNSVLEGAELVVWLYKLIKYGGDGAREAMAFTAYGYDGTSPGNACVFR